VDTMIGRLGLCLMAGSLVLAASAGCGRPARGSETAASTSASAPAPDLGIQVLVQSGSQDAQPLVASVTSSLTSALTSAGYRLVERDGKPDVQAKVTVSATEEQSLFNVEVNGKRSVSYKVVLNASFVSASDSSVVDQAVTEFSSSDGSVDAAAIDKIVAQLGSTGKLAAYSGKLKAKAREEEQKIEQQEEDLWRAADVESCRKPTASKACDGVRAYIQKYPAGKYTADGRKAMQEGDAHMASVEEESVWAASVVEQCQKPTKSYDCKPVENYLKRYPTGAHAADAKAAIKSSEKAREELQKKEEAKQKKASREECNKDCQRYYKGAHPRFYSMLVSRCVQTECD
jgi:hypothetical protein